MTHWMNPLGAKSKVDRGGPLKGPPGETLSAQALTPTREQGRWQHLRWGAVRATISRVFTLKRDIVWPPHPEHTLIPSPAR